MEREPKKYWQTVVYLLCPSVFCIVDNQSDLQGKEMIRVMLRE